MITHLSCFKIKNPEFWKMVRYFHNCLVLICRAKKCQVLIRFRFLNNIPSFLLNMNLYIICDFLFIFSNFKGLKKRIFGRIQANGITVCLMKVQTPIFNLNLIFLSESPCTIRIVTIYTYFSSLLILRIVLDFTGS